MTRRILVPIDFSASSRVALSRAEEVALATGAEVVVLHVGEQTKLATPRRSGLSPAGGGRDQSSGPAPALAALTSQLQARGVKARAVHVDGNPREKILDAIAFERVALVVMGTHGRQGIVRLLLGSVSARVVQDSPIPVVVCRAVDQGSDATGAVCMDDGGGRLRRLRNILVATDFGPGCDVAVSSAFELGSWLDAKVHLLHVYSPVVSATGSGIGAIDYDVLHAAARERLQGLAQAYQASPALGRSVAVMGDPALTIVEGAEALQVDLIVLGSHGHSGLRRALRGSVAETVLRNASCEVLIAKSTLELSDTREGVRGSRAREARR